jgi:hypothetical protein
MSPLLYATCCCACDSFFHLLRLCLFFLDSSSLSKLTVAFNAYVYRRRLFDHIYDVSNSILGYYLLTYMEFRLACFMLSLVCDGRPRYLYDSLVFSSCEKTLRINTARQSTEYMAGSVLARGIRGLNSLPVSARSFPSLQGFRRIDRDFLEISY